MNDLTGYTAEQALNRDLLVHAVNGASLHWARVHGYTADCPPDHVRAEGINVHTRAMWRVDLDDIERAVRKVIERPLACGDVDVIIDAGLLTCVGEILTVARRRRLTHVASLPAVQAGRLHYNRTEFEQMVADVVLQVAVGRRGHLLMATTQIALTPPVTDPAEITDEIRDAGEPSERRVGTLIAAGLNQDAAVAQAADEAVELTRRTAQTTRQCRALVELVDAYASYETGSAYRLLRDLGDHLTLSIAYVDRSTIEAHLERDLSAGEWAATGQQFHALDFDDHVGDAATFRTDWIEGVLDKAGVPGHGYTADGEMAR